MNNRQKIAAAALCFAQVIEVVEQIGGVDRMKDALSYLNSLYDTQEKSESERQADSLKDRLTK